VAAAATTAAAAGKAGSGAADKRKIWAGAAFALLGVAVAIISWRASAPEAATAPQAYFSTDDGATFFPGDGARLPPCEHDGAQAVRAYLYQCKDGKRFVGYLERYSDAAKAVVTAGKTRPLTPAELKTLVNGREFKKPGKNEPWITLNPNEMTMKAVVLRNKMRIKCPDGSTPEPVAD
jgi:hypothetical protein